MIEIDPLTPPCIEMETMINLRGMIHLDQVEDLISNLVSTVDRQQREIDALKQLCGRFMVTDVADERLIREGGHGGLDS